jgi:hypothetical protein
LRGGVRLLLLAALSIGGASACGQSAKEATEVAGTRGARLTSLTLEARRFYNPSRWEDDERTFDVRTNVLIPVELQVADGNAGNHGARLRLHRGEETWTCAYKGGSAQAHPVREQIPLGLTYRLEGCTPAIDTAAPIAIDRVSLKILNGDSRSPSPANPRTVVRATLSIAIGERGCAGVVREKDFLVYPASASTRARFGLARWRMANPTPGPNAFLVTFVGEDEGGTPRYYGAVTADTSRATASGELPSDAAFRSVVALEGRTLSSDEQLAILTAATADRPVDACFGVTAPETLASLSTGMAAPSAPASARAPLPMTVMTMTTPALPGGNGQPFTCGEAQRALDLANLKASIALITPGDPLPAVNDAMFARRALACCIGATSTVASLGPECSCAARSNGAYPVRTTRVNPEPKNGELLQYQCEACPADRPRFSAERNRCEGCPRGQAWNAAAGECRPSTGGDATTSWAPNQTGVGWASGCFYRVTVEFKTQARDRWPVYDENFLVKPDGKAVCNDGGWNPHYRFPFLSYSASFAKPNGGFCDDRDGFCQCDGDCWALEEVAYPCNGLLQSPNPPTRCAGNAQYNAFTFIVPGPISGVGLKSTAPYAGIEYDSDGGRSTPIPFDQEFIDHTLLVGSGFGLLEVSPWETTTAWDTPILGGIGVVRGTPRDRDVRCHGLTDVRIAHVEPYDGPYYDRAWARGSFNDRSHVALLRNIPTCTEPPSEPTTPPPPPDLPGGPNAPTCPDGLTADEYGGCACPSGGPTASTRPECACEHGKVWDAVANACVDNGVRCFGAVGEDCTPLQRSPDPTGLVTCPANTEGLPPEGSRCITDVHWDAVEGTTLQYQAVSVGSIRHDQCCAAHPDGFMCGGEGDEPWHCFSEFGRAASDVLRERTWPVLFDTFEGISRARAVALDDRYFAQLAAPFGARMAPEDARFCQSGRVIQGLEGETICAAVRDERPSIEAPVSAAAPAAVGPAIAAAAATTSTGLGSCERFSGTRQDLRPVVSAHQAYVRDLGEVRGLRYDDMSFYFAALPSAPGEIWVWRDARGTPRALARVAPQHAPAPWTIQPGWEIAAIASAARGAGPALLDCLLDRFEKLGRLPLGARPAQQSVDWWQQQIARRNGIAQGTAQLEPTTGTLFHSPNELDTFVTLGDGAGVSRNVECIEGLYSQYAIALTNDFNYRIRFSPPLNFEQAKAFNPRVLVDSLLASGLSASQIQNVGWASYAAWDRYAGPLSTERAVRFTDRNFCPDGRALASSELLSDTRDGLPPGADLDWAPTLSASRDPDLAWARGLNGYVSQDNAFEILVDYWLLEESRRQGAALPPLRQAFFRRERGLELQVQRGPNAPGQCNRAPVAAPLRPMQSNNPNFFALDCFAGIPYWGDATRAPEEFRDTYEVTSSGGRLVWRRSRPGFWNEGDAVTVRPTQGVERPSPTWVLSPDDRLFVIPGPTPGRDVAHSQTMSGGAVLTAGEIEIESGEVRRITNQSGHYRPTCDSLELARAKLNALAVTVPDARFSCVPD